MESLKFEQWQRGIRAKVDGSWNLHKSFTNAGFFTMLSSIVGIVGHASQAIYAAGNTFQDALAKHRRSLGLHGASLDLGAVEAIGYAAESDRAIMANVSKLGTIPMTMDDVLRVIESSIRESCDGEATPLRSLETTQFITSISPYDTMAEETVVRNDRRFGTLRDVGEGSDGAAAATAVAALKQAITNGKGTRAEAAPLVTAALAEKLADIFSLVPEDMDMGKSLSIYGVDSLVAVELRNWLGSTLKAKVTIFEILESASLTDFGILAANKSELLKA